MSIPKRSIRLQKRSTNSLNVLSGASGEIFYDAANGTLRLYTDNAGDRAIMATRDWVTDQIGITGFDGDYNSLSNLPDLPVVPATVSSFTNDAGYITVAEVPDIDITTIDNIGDVDTSSSAPTTGQLLEYNGANWVNSTVSGFADTNTTYVLASAVDSTLLGIDLTLTNIDGNIDTVNFVPGTGIALTASGNDQITIASSVTLAQLTDTSITTPQDGQTLTYSSGSWLNSVPAASGVALTDLSVTEQSAAAGGALAYDNTTGAFTYTPPDLTSFVDLTSLSINSSPASGSGSLQYDNTTGIFTFRPANLSTYVELGDLSVSAQAASGSGSLVYDNSTGVFTYTPPVAGGDIVNDVTPQLGGNLDINGNNITGTGDISITGDVTADSYALTTPGTPVITSATTITLNSPDGTTITNGTNGVLIDAGDIVLDNNLYLGTASQALPNPAVGNYVGITLNTDGSIQATRNTSDVGNAIIYTNKNGNVGEHIQIRRPGFGGPQRVGAIGESATGNQLGIFNQTSVEVAKTGELGVVFGSYTTTERNLATATAGEVIFNTTDTKLQVWSGAAWIDAALPSSGIGINFLSDVDTISSTPATGNVLKWDGAKWAPGVDATSGGGGLDADTLDGQDGSYYLNYNNFTNTPSVLALTSLSVGNELTASGDGAISYDDSTGVFRYTPPDLSTYLTSVPAQSFASLTGKPTTLSGYGITDAQATLVSATNIKTINSTSILGTGDITITAGDPDQNLWATIAGDTGTTTANTIIDSLTIAGGADITTSVAGDILTVAFSGTIPADVSELTDTTNLLDGPERFAAITQLLVTNNFSSAYLINNQYSGNNPTVYAISGTTIAFELDCNGHPFIIETSGGAQFDTGLIHIADNGTKTTGAGAQGKVSGILYWQIPAATTGNYAYQCSFHSVMRGTITIKDIATL